MSADGRNDLFRTQGIRANRCKDFPVVLPGERWYRILNREEKRAEQSHDFTEISELVVDVLDIRKQLKLHGF